MREGCFENLICAILALLLLAAGMQTLQLRSLRNQAAQCRAALEDVTEERQLLEDSAIDRTSLTVVNWF